MINVKKEASSVDFEIILERRLCPTNMIKKQLTMRLILLRRTNKENHP